MVAAFLRVRGMESLDPENIVALERSYYCAMLSIRAFA
jgi:hypothetical protein